MGGPNVIECDSGMLVAKDAMTILGTIGVREPPRDQLRRDLTSAELADLGIQPGAG